MASATDPNSGSVSWSVFWMSSQASSYGRRFAVSRSPSFTGESTAKGFRLIVMRTFSPPSTSFNTSPVRFFSSFADTDFIVVTKQYKVTTYFGQARAFKLSGAGAPSARKSTVHYRRWRARRPHYFFLTHTLGRWPDRLLRRACLAGNRPASLPQLEELQAPRTLRDR